MPFSIQGENYDASSSILGNIVKLPNGHEFNFTIEIPSEQLNAVVSMNVFSFYSRENLIMQKLLIRISVFL